jgi:hypothetical protein
LAKLVRAEGQRFEVCTLGTKSPFCAEGEFTRRGRKEISSRETEQHEIIYFKIYKSQIPVIEQALETAALMLGTDKGTWVVPRDDRADFLGGANLDNGNPDPAADHPAILQIPTWRPEARFS